MKRLRVLFPTFILFAFAGVAISAACQEREQRRPSRYLIPEGYVGWIRIDFKVKDAPPLPVEDERYLFKIPHSGHLKTSSDIEYGWASGDDFYYSGKTRRKLVETMWGKGGMIWGQSNGSAEDSAGNKTAIYEHVFIGTEEQFKKCAWERDENYNLKVGAIDEEKLKKCVER